MTFPERALGDVLRQDIADEIVQPDRDYPIAGIYGFGRGLFQRGPIRSDETSYPKLNRLAAGRLVMSRLKAFEGAIAVIPPEFNGWYLSPEFPTFAIDPVQADERYIANLCAWPELWTRLGAQSKGVGARKVRVSAERLLEIKVPLPDLDEQHRIAARLDSAMSTVTALRKKRLHAAKLQDSLHESVFSDDEQGAPVRIGSVLTLERLPVEPDPDKYYTQIGIRSFGNGIFHRDKMLGSELGKLRYFTVQSDRLIVSNIMAWEGAIAVSTDHDAGCIASNRFLSYRKSGEVDIRYLNYYFHSKKGHATIRSTSTGTVVRNQTLSIKDFEELIVPLPSLGRQQRVAAWLDTCSSLGRFAATQEESVSQLKLSLLNAAFSSRL
jgi:type I restriction enzyme, S subunit